MAAQQPPARPPGVTEQQIQQAIQQRGLGDLLRQRIQQSGLSSDQIRSRLRAAGYSESAVDAYLGPSVAGQQLPAPSLETLRAASAAGLGDFGLATDTLSAFLRQVALSQGDSILLDSLGFALGRDSVPGKPDANGILRLDTVAALRISTWLRRSSRRGRVPGRGG